MNRHCISATRQRIGAIGSLLAILLVLTACGGTPLGSTAEVNRSAASSAPAGSSAAPAPASVGSAAPASSSAPRVAASSAPSSAASSAPSSAASTAPKAQPTAAAVSQVGPGTTQADPNAPPRRMLIKNGTLGLIVRDVDAAFGQISAIAARHGGEVSQYTNSKNGATRTATVAIVVDVAQFEAAMTALREMGEIVERRTDKAESTDVGEEFADIQAQIVNLETTERQLRAILEKATKTEDILTVQREITNVRGQIERLQGRANYLDRRSAVSTITISMETVPPPASPSPSPTPAPEPAAAPEWRFTIVVSDAWQASLRVLRVIVSAVVTVVVFGWWFLPFLAIAALIAFARRGRAPGRSADSPPPAATGD